MELFRYCDLELDPMTFISELDPDIVMTYLHAQNEVNRSNGSKVIIQTDCAHRETNRHIDRHERNLYLPAFVGGNKRIYTSNV